MPYLESSVSSSAPYQGQMASSSKDSILKYVNLYRGEAAVTFNLVSLPGPDGLDLTLSMSYQPSEKNFYQSNRMSSAGAVGTGMVLPLGRIYVRDRQMKETYQSEYCISGEGGEFPLYRSGVGENSVIFRSVEHPFWRFRKLDDCWEVIRDDGSVWVYGRTPDSREIKVYWGNWTGPCTSPGGEECVVGWYLSEVRNPYGVRVTFSYDNRKLPFGGCEYTSEIYLDTAVSAYGDTVKLHYLPKDEREYILPHDPGTGAYQFSCERCYLDCVDVFSENGSLLYSQKMEYALIETSEREAKRLLTGMSQVAPDGEMQPPLRIDWNTDRDFPGRIGRIVYPRSGAVSFSYEKQCPAQYDPSVFQELEDGWEHQAVNGADFTAVLLTRESDRSARLILYGWDMSWQVYEDGELAAQAVEKASLFTGNGLVCVRFFSPLDHCYHLRIVKRVPVRRYDWEGFDAVVSGTVCPSVACGDDFVGVQCTDRNMILIWQFNYLDNEWHTFELPADIMEHQVIGAGRGCIFGAYGNENSGTVRLTAFYCDEDHEWKQGGVTDVPVDVTWQYESSLPVWSINGAMAGACFVGDAGNEIEAVLITVSWDREYRFDRQEAVRVTQPKEAGNPVYFCVARDTLIGFANTVLRYTPEGFVRGQLFSVSDQCEYAYAYGSDLILGVEKSADGSQRFAGKRFDPVRGEWTEEGAPYAEQTGHARICHPVITAGYALLGRGIFMRTPDDTWEKIGTLPLEADASTARLDPEGAYLLYSIPQESLTKYVPLEGGILGEVSDITGYVAGEESGYEAGTGSFYLQASDTMSRGLSLFCLSGQKYTPETPAVTCLRSVTLDSGLDVQHVYLDYDMTKARLENGCFAMGRAVVSPADKDGGYGSTEYDYYSGSSPAWTDYPDPDQFCNAADYYSHFAGQLYKTISFDGDGNRISQTVNDIRALDAHGFCIQQTRITQSDYVKRFLIEGSVERMQTDEIRSVVEYEYEPVYSRRCRVRNRFWDKDGREGLSARNITYAFQEIPGMKEANRLNDVLTVVEENETENEITNRQRFEYARSPEGYYYQTAEYTAGREEDEWFLQEEVTEVNGRCHVLCKTDERGIPESTLYDRSGRYPVAVTGGAEPREVLYCGFEPYEAGDRISVSGEPAGQYLTEETAFSGTRCLKIPAGKKALFQVGVRENGLRVRFSVKADSPVDVTVDFGRGSTEKKQFCRGSDSGELCGDGAWHTIRDLFHSRTETDAALVMISSESEICLDAVYITPVLSSGEASVYTGPRMLQSALHRSEAPGTRTYFDKYDVPAVTAGDDGTFLEFTNTLYHSDGNPNEQYAVKPSSQGAWYDAGQGYLETPLFRQSEGGWQFCKARSFCLIFSDACVKGTQMPAVRIGDAELVRNQTGWNLRNNGQVQRADAQKDRFWLLLKMGDRCRFYGDGRELFTFRISQEDAELTMTEAAGLCFLGYIPSPHVVVSCADYSGRVHQDQIVTERGVHIVHTLYDPAGVQTARTAQTEAEGEFWGYRPDFVTGYDRETGETTGEINRCFPEANGYPCTSFHMSAGRQPILKEMACPGQQFAFGNGLTVKHDVCSVGGFSSFLEDGICHAMTMTDADGMVTVRVMDGRGDVLSGRISPDGSIREITGYDLDARGNKVKIYYPKYFEGDDRYVTEISYDSIGNIAKRRDPDTEEVTSVYDRYGNLRFLRLGSEERYVYHLYDRYGKKTEIGYVNSAWDDAALRREADQADVRPEGGVPVRIFRYGETPEKGEASDQAGRLTSVITVVDGETVEERYEYDCRGRQIRYLLLTDERQEECVTTYDLAGNVISRSTGNDGDGLLEYRYGNNGELTEILYNGTAIYHCGYTQRGKLAYETFGNCMRSSYKYNTADYLTEINGTWLSQKISYFEGTRAKKGGQIAGVQTRTYKDGNRSSPVDSGFEASYDGLGRIKEVIVNGHTENCYAYDINGNEIRDGLVYVPGTDRLKQADQEEVVYERFGAVKAVGSRKEFLYEPVTQMVRSMIVEGEKTDYRLGGGICGFDNGNGLTLSVCSEDGKLFYEREENGRCVLLVYGANGAFAQIIDGKVYYMIRDYRASVRGIADENGLLASYGYDLFGNVISRWESSSLSESLIPLRFAGARLEQSGIYRFQMRFYDAESGRFFSVDPEAQYPNPYLYGGCDWINYFDPDGAFSTAGFLASFFTGLALIAVGVVITVATAGIGGAAGVLLSTAAAGLIGAGISSTIYSITSAINDDFSWGAWGIQLGMGAVFGMISAGIGAAVPSTIGVAGSMLYDSVSGMIVGAADGIVTNGILNIEAGRSFWDNAAANGITGAVAGGVLGAVTGMSTAARNAKGLTRRNTNGQMILKNNKGGLCGGHSRIGVHAGGNQGSQTVPGAHLVYREEGRHKIAVIEQQGITVPNSAVSRINVTENVYGRLSQGIRNVSRSDYGTYSMVFNSCTGYVIKLSSDAGIYQPLWTRSPVTMDWWAKFTGWFQV